MTLKQYKAFVYTVESGSVTAAAERLNSSQTALTHLIKSLEEELGFTLMTRNKSGVTLTERGKRLFTVMKEAVLCDDRVNTLVEKIKGESKNTVNIATFTSVAVNWLPSIMSGFSKIRPDVTITLTDGGYSDITAALEAGVADIGFISHTQETYTDAYPLVKDRILAVLPEGHELASLKSLPVSCFESQSVISLTENTDFDSRRVFESAGIKPNIRYRTSDDYAMISMVENGLGICLVPELLLGKRQANVRVMELDPPAFRTIALAVSYEAQATEAVRQLKQYIIEWVKENVKEK